MDSVPPQLRRLLEHHPADAAACGTKARRHGAAHPRWAAAAAANADAGAVGSSPVPGARRGHVSAGTMEGPRRDVCVHQNMPGFPRGCVCGEECEGSEIAPAARGGEGLGGGVSADLWGGCGGGDDGGRGCGRTGVGVVWENGGVCGDDGDGKEKRA